MGKRSDELSQLGFSQSEIPHGESRSHAVHPTRTSGEQCAVAVPNALRQRVRPLTYFLVGAGDGGGLFTEPPGDAPVFAEPCARVGGGFTSCHSPSKISAELGPISGPIARSP